MLETHTPVCSLLPPNHQQESLVKTQQTLNRWIPMDLGCNAFTASRTWTRCISWSLLTLLSWPMLHADGYSKLIHQSRYVASYCVWEHIVGSRDRVLHTYIGLNVFSLQSLTPGWIQGPLNSRPLRRGLFGYHIGKIMSLVQWRRQLQRIL